MLFILVNLARFVKVDPEQALRRTNAKFRARFGYVEAAVGGARQNLRGQHARGNGGAVAGSQAVIDVRAADDSTDEFREAVALQKTIWGFEDLDLLPVRLFVAAGKIGGQVFGAYDGDAWSDSASRFPA